MREIVKKYLLECRPGDWEHALRVLNWVEELGRDREDLETLRLVALIHDIGWYKILPDNSHKITKEELKQYEPQANKNTEKMVNRILDELEKNTKSKGFNKNIVLRLIDAADKHHSSEEDEAIIVDADNISKLDIEHLKDKYKKQDWLKMYELWKQTFPSRIQTTRGKKVYPHLLKELKQSIENQ